MPQVAVPIADDAISPGGQNGGLGGGQIPSNNYYTGTQGWQNTSAGQTPQGEIANYGAQQYPGGGPGGRGEGTSGALSGAAASGAYGGVAGALNGGVGDALSGAAASGAYGYAAGAIAGGNPPTTPSGGNSGGGGGGGYPSGGGGGGGGSSSTSVQAGSNNAPLQNTELGDPTNYLLHEYNSMDNYQQAMTDLINANTAQQIDLAHAQIDELLAAQLSALSMQLDQGKREFGVLRAKMEQMKATEGDNLVFQNAAKGNFGGTANAQYMAAMKQRDQALYEIDLQWMNYEEQLNQAIIEAKATGNYEKLAKTIELTSAGFQQLVNLMSEVMQVKTNDAAQLDNYYEGIREFDATYNLDVQQIQQNAVLNKINAGISVSPEDMMIFGLTGADAQTAADNINASQGVQRQILQEQLRQLQNSYNSYSGGGSGGGGGGSYSGGYGFKYDQTVPSAVMQVIEATLDSNGGLEYWLPNGGGGTVWASSQGGLTSSLPAGATVNAPGYGNYTWDGSKWVRQEDYAAAASNGSSGGSAGTVGSQVSDAYQAQINHYQDLLWQRYLELYNKYGGQFIEANGGYFDPAAYISNNDPYWVYAQYISDLQQGIWR